MLTLYVVSTLFDLKETLIISNLFCSLDNKPFIIGSRATVSLEITVENKAEPAYVANLTVILPENVYFAQIPSMCENLPIIDKTSSEIIVCRLGNLEVSYFAITFTLLLLAQPRRAGALSIPVTLAPSTLNIAVFSGQTSF